MARMVPIRGYRPTEFDGGGDAWGVGRDLLKDKENAVEIYQRTRANKLNQEGKELANRKGELDLEELERVYGTKKKVREQISQKAKEQSAEGKPFSDDDMFQAAQQILGQEGDFEQMLELGEEQSKMSSRKLKNRSDAFSQAQKEAEVTPEDALRLLQEEYPDEYPNIRKPSDLRGPVNIQDKEGNIYEKFPDGTTSLKTSQRERRGAEEKEFTKEYTDPEGNTKLFTGTATQHNVLLDNGFKLVKSNSFMDDYMQRMSQGSMKPTPTPTPVPGIVRRVPVKPKQ